MKQLLILLSVLSFSIYGQVEYSRKINSYDLKALLEVGMSEFVKQNKYSSLDFIVESYSYYTEEYNHMSFVNELNKRLCWGNDCESISDESFSEPQKLIDSLCEDMQEEVDDFKRVKKVCDKMSYILSKMKKYGYKLEAVALTYSNNEDYERGIIIAAHDEDGGYMYKISYLRQM